MVEDVDQARWNELGRRQSEAIAAHPERFIISADEFPMPYRLDDEQVGDLLEELGPLKKRNVLELGCGYGKSAVYLARRGARVTAVDRNLARFALIVYRKRYGAP